MESPVRSANLASDANRDLARGEWFHVEQPDLEFVTPSWEEVIKSSVFLKRAFHVELS
jgi:hypothetical protein